MFSRMAIYTVYLKPEKLLSEQKPVFVKESFNFPAFLIPLPWMLYKRLWFPAILLFGWSVLLIFLGSSGLFSTFDLTTLDVGMHVIIGLCANDWLRKNLSRKGYILSDITVADSLLRAQQRYFDRCYA